MNTIVFREKDSLYKVLCIYSINNIAGVHNMGIVTIFEHELPFNSVVVLKALRSKFPTKFLSEKSLSHRHRFIRNVVSEWWIFRSEIGVRG